MLEVDLCNVKPEVALQNDARSCVDLSSYQTNRPNFCMPLLASQITLKHERQVLETATIAYSLDDSSYGQIGRTALCRCAKSMGLRFQFTFYCSMSATIHNLPFGLRSFAKPDMDSQ